MNEFVEKTITRLVDCKLTEVGEQMVCDRCGILFEITDSAPPACSPITFARMRERLCQEISSAETSLEIVTSLKRKGEPADAAPAKRKLAELEALLRFFDLSKQKHDAEKAKKA